MTSTTAPTATALAFTGLVSLGLFGASFAVDPATGVGDQDGDEPELVVFMNTDATSAQTDAVRAALDAGNGIGDVTYLDQQATFDEFEEQFADKPELIDSVTAEVLPPSFRVDADGLSTAEVETFGATLDELPGVREVRYAFTAREQRADVIAVLASDLGVAESELTDPAWIDRNIDWVLRAAAAALLIPTALLAVALNRSRPTTTAEVH
jgi:cell division protein FtsX